MDTTTVKNKADNKLDKPNVDIVFEDLMVTIYVGKRVGNKISSFFTGEFTNTFLKRLNDE